MKEYIKPIIITEAIELEDVIANSPTLSDSEANWDSFTKGIWDIF